MTLISAESIELFIRGEKSRGKCPDTPGNSPSEEVRDIGHQRAVGPRIYNTKCTK